MKHSKGGTGGQVKLPERGRRRAGETWERGPGVQVKPEIGAREGRKGAAGG